METACGSRLSRWGIGLGEAVTLDDAVRLRGESFWTGDEHRCPEERLALQLQAESVVIGASVATHRDIADRLAVIRPVTFAEAGSALPPPASFFSVSVSLSE